MLAAQTAAGFADLGETNGTHVVVFAALLVGQFGCFLPAVGGSLALRTALLADGFGEKILPAFLFIGFRFDLDHLHDASAVFLGGGSGLSVSRREDDCVVEAGVLTVEFRALLRLLIGHLKSN